MIQRRELRLAFFSERRAVTLKKENVGEYLWGLILGLMKSLQSFQSPKKQEVVILWKDVVKVTTKQDIYGILKDRIISLQVVTINRRRKVGKDTPTSI